jgi:hypothetical protein
MKRGSIEDGPVSGKELAELLASFDAELRS